MNSPCRDCPDRSVGCHSNCEKYKAFCAENEAYKQRRKEIQNRQDYSRRKYEQFTKMRNHYNHGGIECIEALKAATVGLEGIEAVCTANAIKYMWRWKHKNGVEDINKAIRYLERLKKEVQEDAAD